MINPPSKSTKAIPATINVLIEIALSVGPVVWQLVNGIIGCQTIELNKAA
jgi:hypothetical protein